VFNDANMRCVDSLTFFCQLSDPGSWMLAEDSFVVTLMNSMIRGQ